MNASTGTAQNLRSEGYQGEALASWSRIKITVVADSAHRSTLPSRHVGLGTRRYVETRVSPPAKPRGHRSSSGSVSPRKRPSRWTQVEAANRFDLTLT